MALKELLVKDDTLKGKEFKVLKLKFLAFATQFDEDLKANLELSSLDLNDKYQTQDHMGWRRFLKQATVSTYRNDFLMEIAENKANSRLGEDIGKTTDALNVKKMVDSKKVKDDNSDIVVWLMPQKNYFRGSDS